MSFQSFVLRHLVMTQPSIRSHAILLMHAFITVMQNTENARVVGEFKGFILATAVSLFNLSQ